MNTPSPGAVSRRQFITASTAATAWFAFSQNGFAQALALKPSEQLNVAIVGCGNQGRVLINDCLKLPYVKVCTAVIASGDVGYYKHRKWYDNVLAIYEYARPEGTSRVSYNVLTTNSLFNRFEKVMGIES